MRIHLFEFEDQQWFPHVIREGMMDYLRHMINWLDYYQPAAALIQNVVEQSNSNQILEVCAGSGGGAKKMRRYLNRLHCNQKLILSDLFPNIEVYETLKKESGGEIDFISEPVNALNVSAELNGVRTMFSALHHFKPHQVKAILQDAVDKKTPMAIFDTASMGLLNIGAILSVLILEPITFVLLTPFFKPFRWSRLIFTYVLPLIILCTLWDGTVSVLRFYSEKNLRRIASETSSENFIWKIGHFKNKIGVNVNYVIGIPS